MILWNLPLLFRDPLLFFIRILTVILALLIVVTFHEFSHAWVADRLGDDTARRMGRLSLNPLAHLDRLGTLMFLLVGFGWGKPVPVNPYRLRRDPRSGMAIVAAVGPLSNLIMAGMFSILFRLELLSLHPLSAFSFSGIFSILIFDIIRLNLIVAIFNSLPIPPLDGFKVAVGILPPRWAYSLAGTERYGWMILLMLIALNLFTGFLWDIIRFGVNLFSVILLGQGLL
ncbi:site-2 protease family protein [Dehalococcoidia bacterium]|nr:site-2 protease family protein [Dehalococcoidia bacterium]